MDKKDLNDLQEDLRLLEEIGSLMAHVDWDEWRAHDSRDLDALGWFLETTAFRLNNRIEGKENKLHREIARLRNVAESKAAESSEQLPGTMKAVNN